MNNNTKETYCGFVSIVGRSNVGKSTLLNKLIGHKVSITSSKVRTTCRPIIGVDTKDNYQTIYIDSPGFYIEKEKRIINKLIGNNYSDSFVSNVELIIFVIDGTKWLTTDRILLNKLQKEEIPVVLVINKVDNIQKKTQLLPHLQFLASQMNFLEIIPASAKAGINISVIKQVIYKNLPVAIHLFSKNYINKYYQRFIISEIIREKLMRLLGRELPYSVTVNIEQFITNKCGNYDINSSIFVKHKGQKKIVIGNKGIKIKLISIKARKDIQKILKSQVNLKLWVKVKPI